MCFALKATNAVTFRPLRCYSPVFLGYFLGDIWKKYPRKINEKHLKGPKVTVFVAFNAKHILLGPYWFKENGHTVTINNECYIAILDQFHGDLTQKLTQGQLRLAWFMQDGARPHTAHASLKHLRVFSRIF